MEHKTYPVMDKYKPSYDLRKIQQTGYVITRTALTSAAELGFDADGIHEVIASMEKSHFYKSMTSKYNHKVWQDVYHVPFSDYLLYIKFTAEQEISEFRLLSFKEK